MAYYPSLNDIKESPSTGYYPSLEDIQEPPKKTMNLAKDIYSQIAAASPNQENRFLPNTEIKSSPIRDAIIGIATGGQNLSHKVSDPLRKAFGYKPTDKIDFNQLFGVDPNTIDKLIQGAAQYAPYGAAGGASLLGKALAGGAFGATQGEHPLKNSAEDAVLNILLHGAGETVKALRPSNLLRGRLSPEEIAANVRAAAGTETDLGSIIGSPSLKKKYENELASMPFTGAEDKIAGVDQTIRSRGSDILQGLVGKDAEPGDVGKKLQSSLVKTYENQRSNKNKLYTERNEIADNANLNLELPKFAEKASEFSNELENTNILKNESTERKLISKLANYKNPVTEVKGKIIDTEGNPLSSERSYPSFKESALLKGKLNSLARDYEKSVAPDDRRMAKVFGDLASALGKDLNESIERSGNKELKLAHERAEKNYAENYAPFLDQDVYPYLQRSGSKSDSDMLLQGFIKTGRTNDRGNLLNKFVSKLPDQERKLAGYGYLSRALDNEGKLNPAKMATLVEGLGNKQFKALFPEASMRRELKDYTRLVNMNKEAVYRMQNPKTGARGVAPSISTLRGLMAGGGGVLGGIPGAVLGYAAPAVIGRQATKYLTNEDTRNKLINAMIEQKPLAYKPGGALSQTVAQSLAKLIQGS